MRAATTRPNGYAARAQQRKAPGTRSGSYSARAHAKASSQLPPGKDFVHEWAMMGVRQQQCLLAIFEVRRTARPAALADVGS